MPLRSLPRHAELLVPLGSGRASLLVQRLGNPPRTESGTGQTSDHFFPRNSFPAETVVATDAARWVSFPVDSIVVSRTAWAGRRRRRSYSVSTSSSNSHVPHLSAVAIRRIVVAVGTLSRVSHSDTCAWRFKPSLLASSSCDTPRAERSRFKFSRNKRAKCGEYACNCFICNHLHNTNISS